MARTKQTARKTNKGRGIRPITELPEPKTTRPRIAKAKVTPKPKPTPNKSKLRSQSSQASSKASESDGVFEVEQILSSREGEDGTEYLIKWLEWPSSSNSWEPEGNIAHLKSMLRKFKAQQAKTSNGVSITTASPSKRLKLSENEDNEVKDDEKEADDQDKSHIYSFDDDSDDRDEDDNDGDSDSKKKTSKSKKGRAKSRASIGRKDLSMSSRKSAQSPPKPYRIISSLRFSPDSTPSPTPKAKQSPSKSRRSPVKTPKSKPPPVILTSPSKSNNRSSQKGAKKISGQEFDLAKLQDVEVLSNSTTKKEVTVKGKIGDDDAIISFHKTNILNDDVLEIVNDSRTKLIGDFTNDVYGNFYLYPSVQSINKMSVKTIFPADEKAIAKYTHDQKVFIHETPDMYKSIVEKYIHSQEADEWIVNILNGSYEQDRIIFNDKNKNNGFVLLPSVKWTGDEKQPYLIAIVHRSDIRSLRDLNDKHIPMLKNILQKSSLAIKNKYKDLDGHIRAYVHYHPTFYHFHVHLKVENLNDYASTDRDHLLQNVINNLEISGDYYKNATLTHPLSVRHALYHDLKQ